MLTFKCVLWNDFVVKWCSSLCGCSLIWHFWGSGLILIYNTKYHWVRWGWRWEVAEACHVIVNQCIFSLIIRVVSCRYGWGNFYNPVQCFPHSSHLLFRHMSYVFASWLCRTFCWSRCCHATNVGHALIMWLMPDNRLGADMILAKVLDVPLCMVWLLELLPLTIGLHSGELLTKRMRKHKGQEWGSSEMWSWVDIMANFPTYNQEK